MLMVLETLVVFAGVIGLIGIVMLGIMIQSGTVPLPGSPSRRVQQAEAEAKVAAAKVKIAEAQHREALLQLNIDAVHTKRLELASGETDVEEVTDFILVEEDNV